MKATDWNIRGGGEERELLRSLAEAPEHKNGRSFRKRLLYRLHRRMCPVRQGDHSVQLRGG